MNNNNEKVLVAMSGGVDSSAAALLLKEQGYELVGVSMRLVSCNKSSESDCCTVQDRRDARSVCDQLGIDYSVVDYSSIFKREVVEPFVSEYLKGRTPSPCIRCNQFLKFQALFDEADKLGAAKVATGHYARIIEDDEGFHLLAACDEKKDQSYFLFTLTQKELGRVLFPLGDMTKQEARAISSKAGLVTSEKSESQEICFAMGDYVSFIEEFAGDSLQGPGDFVDMSGNVIGRHDGVHAFTIGQRRGIGFGTGTRMYVVGSNDDLLRQGMVVRDVSWVNPSFCKPRDARVKIRSVGKGNDAHITPREDGSVEVTFQTPVRAIAPGQAAVFYDGDEVVGGGWISSDVQ
jgi:tRNA-uridine 2-sulfurtransferase